MIFEWDPEKAKINLSKHGVSFQEASEVLGDPLSDTFDDPDHSENELRFIIIGHTESGKLLFVSHRDDGNKIRIISAKELTRVERKQFEEGN